MFSPDFTWVVSDFIQTPAYVCKTCMLPAERQTSMISPFKGRCSVVEHVLLFQVHHILRSLGLILVYAWLVGLAVYCGQSSV
jgi:hypothetical protein